MFKHNFIFLFSLVFSLGLTGCATLNAPVAQIKANQEEAMTTKYKGKTIKEVYADLGNPGTQGHWGAGEYAFVALYPLGDEPTIPQYKFGMIKGNWKCYVFRFEKEKGNQLYDVALDDCAGGRAPSRIDHDYANQ
jgi:hypothetical protein